MKITFTGQQPVYVHNIGIFEPGDTKDIDGPIGPHLLRRTDFIPTPKPVPVRAITKAKAPAKAKNTNTQEVCDQPSN
ncbi:MULTISPECIES: hypothetical protein [Arthrobacter]|uniref:Uncharacterized protein n=1 Tax=Arthrobacter terricola TaxID=2547396 RepID=A0A4V2ZTE6_9MICC|nr:MULTISPECIES: hypothetical protein [Arthrobacter]MBT8160990.1 hypothetical protein [Arthrobacter sp. GN70]TDF96854.1 hypothetical protein E1809_09020 [Arthrobacter terricola]